MHTVRPNGKAAKRAPHDCEANPRLVPSPLYLFCVHRMALASTVKELGNEVAGSSTAAGAIRRLAHEFLEAGTAIV